MTPLQHLRALFAQDRPILRSFAGQTDGGPDVHVAYDGSARLVTVTVRTPCSPGQLQALLEGGEL